MGGRPPLTHLLSRLSCVALVLLSACLPLPRIPAAAPAPVAIWDDAWQQPESYPVAHPGDVLINAARRREQLAGLDEMPRSRLCGPKGVSSWPSHGPVRNVTAAEQPGHALSLTLMQAGGAILAYDDRQARRTALNNLRRWAKAGALSIFKEPIDANSFYNLDRTLMPIIATYALVRGDVLLKPEHRAVIDQWLDGLVRKRGPDRVVDESRVSSRNNHRYLRDSVTMAWGALIGDDALFRTGIRRFHLALEQMRADGSLPLETARGDLALYYQRHAIGSLVTIAEMAAAQGYDLYAAQSSKGLTIHAMVAFLARGIEDPTILAPYAQEAQDLRFLTTRGHLRHYMAWLEAYAARFPDEPATLALRRAIRLGPEAATPMLDDYAGGMTACLYRPVNQL